MNVEAATFDVRVEVIIKKALWTAPNLLIELYMFFRVKHTGINFIFFSSFMTRRFLENCRSQEAAFHLPSS